MLPSIWTQSTVIAIKQEHKQIQKNMLLKAGHPFIVPPDIFSPEGGGTLSFTSCHLLVMNFIRLLR